MTLFLIEEGEAYIRRTPSAHEENMQTERRMARFKNIQLLEIPEDIEPKIPEIVITRPTNSF